ncbi:inositol hexakisphosphate-domain-containing protein [Paraphysoderma sedebokerense]|nr:inositol hexakisphosphate-domain-containing protein [Paraphysoderma sedebokerense]
MSSPKSSLLATSPVSSMLARMSQLNTSSAPSSPSMGNLDKSSKKSNRSRVDLIAKSSKDLLKMVGGVVRNRTGAVLSRSNILKTEYRFSGLINMDLHLQGAPNFRGSALNVFGCAQPSVAGLSTILTVFNCHPESTSAESSSTLWFSTREEPIIYLNGRPYCLRDEQFPLQNLKTYAGISSARLEQMEQRLKDDIIKESKKYNGLLLVHDELEEGKVIPCWVAADEVQTPREVIESFQEKGYRVKYARIPISPEQAPEDQYLDEYVNIIKSTPSSDSIVVTCGMGGGRTTFGMIAAILIRRAQLIAEKKEDPFHMDGLKRNGSTDIWEMHESYAQNTAMLRMMYILEKGLNSPMSPRSAIEWALARGDLIDNLKNAVLGNYQFIQDLARVLENGHSTKKLLDEIINRCDTVINLREDILMHRIKHTVIGDIQSLEKAVGCLERYFFLLAFAGYVNEHGVEMKDGSFLDIDFSSWLTIRPEIWSMLESLRQKGRKLHLFRPVEDLSELSSGVESISGADGNRLIANELEQFVTKNRSGTILTQNAILKVDFWPQEGVDKSPISGAARFRRVDSTKIYAVAQPSLKGISNVLNYIKGETPNIRICWINLREEPILYINGAPYVLRDQYATLRNIKSFQGITSTRLEIMESRLKEDVINELAAYDSKLLLHSETAEGKVIPLWEDVIIDNVLTLKEAMNLADIRVHYHRVPVTAEATPDETDFDHIMQVLASEDWKNSAIVVNCQVGLGRSTYGTIVTSLVVNWLSGYKSFNTPSIASDASGIVSPQPKATYQIIHSLLRTIRNGLEVKKLVDHTIDQCSSYLNIRDSIEDYRLKSENESDEVNKKKWIRKGLLSLERYFGLIVFQAYLDEITPATIHTTEPFKSWIQRHPEILTIKAEFARNEEKSLIPVERQTAGDGVALTSEVTQVVNQRAGAVLATQTILKHDAFPGCQKLSLPDRIEGAPNFRQVKLVEVRKGVRSLIRKSAVSTGLDLGKVDENEISKVIGVAMPTSEGIKNLLKKVDAAPGGTRKLMWTCLREEPVIYINTRPYVLRLFQDPLKNLEATGINSERVELMEERMKNDVLMELKKYNGRCLLHEEEILPNGGFSIIPVWETVKPSDVQTPKEVFQNIKSQGYNVDYLRIPITDEQAPIPDVFDQLVNRVNDLESLVDAIFNCQMGRGRTTTGMVITCILDLVLGNHTMLTEFLTAPSTPYSEFADNEFPLPLSTTTGSSAQQSLTRQSSSEDMSFREQYLRGEYKIILQLLSVLSHGKLSKRITDFSIDSCSHMQNLMSAIYDYKLRVESSEIGSKKYWMYRETGLNYLIRYFYLIVFTDYLIEMVVSIEKEKEKVLRHKKRKDVDEDVGLELGMEGIDDIDGVSEKWEEGEEDKSGKLKGSILPMKFTEWLSQRREITSIIRKSNQDFS